MITGSTIHGVQTLAQPDGYRIHFRLRGSGTAADLVVLLQRPGGARWMLGRSGN